MTNKTVLVEWDIDDRLPNFKISKLELNSFCIDRTSCHILNNLCFCSGIMNVEKISYIYIYEFLLYSLFLEAHLETTRLFTKRFLP